MKTGLITAAILFALSPLTEARAESRITNLTYPITGEQSETDKNALDNPLLQFVAGEGACGAYCHDKDPSRRKQCASDQRPVYGNDGSCSCVHRKECE